MEQRLQTTGREGSGTEFEHAISSHGNLAKNALLCCLLSGLIPIVSSAFSFEFVKACTDHRGSSTRKGPVEAMCAWDGQWYVQIVKRGYSWHPSRKSSVAFFPLYPSLAWTVNRITGLGVELSLLFVSNAAFALGCVLFEAYLETIGKQCADRPRCESVLLCLMLLPTSYFYRAAYTESLFFCTSAAVFLAIGARAPVFVVAALAGLTTATRLVGVAFVPVVVWYAWRHSPSPGKRLANLSAVPLSMSGLVAYAAWLSWRFGEPLAFAQAQQQWTMRPLPEGAFAIIKAITIGPIVDVFDADCTICFWANRQPVDNALFNLWLLNPVVFLGTLALVGFGACKRWLTGYETVASLGILMIPYFSQGYRTCMASQSRYALAAFPAMIVLAKLVEKLPGWCQSLCFAMSAVLLAVYSSLFFAWYWFY